LRKIYAAQQQSEWCWAACISMLFAFYDHPVAQVRVVRDAYGSIANMPGNYPALFGSLDRTWEDEGGGEFSVSVNSLFAPEFGITLQSINDLVDELSFERPILHCTTQHAMVLTALKYLNGNAVAAWVMDPWPGVGVRQLAPIELVPFTQGGMLRMVATIAVD
jgi:hypothetical protein